MATIQDATIIKTMLENDGVYEGDPAVARIYLYSNSHAPGDHYAIFYNYRDDDMARSPFVDMYMKLFDNGAPTNEGLIWLQRRAQRTESTEKSL